MKWIDVETYQREVDNLRLLEKGIIPKEALDNVQEEISNTPYSFRKHYNDGYHSFKELYETIDSFSIAFFNMLASHKQRSIDFSNMSTVEINAPLFNVHKSKRHHDGELCFDGEYFIVVAQLPNGQISKHFHIDKWDDFKVPIAQQALYEWDGHTTQDVCKRLKELNFKF